MPCSIPLFDAVERFGVPFAEPPRRQLVFQYSFRRLKPGGSTLRLVRALGARGRVVCDSSAFRREYPEFARDLLALGDVYIPPSAVPELKALRQDPAARALATVIFQADGSLRPAIRPTDPPVDLASIARHYVGLLAARKLVRAARGRAGTGVVPCRLVPTVPSKT